MNRPEMILFDYGGTILYEPGFDWVNGEREVFKHVKKNPNHLTPEELSRFEKDFFVSAGICRDLGYELHEHQMLRLKYEYNEIELDISYEEAERILWSYTSPLTEKAKTPYVEELLACLKEKGIRKPSPVIFELALRKAGLNSSQVWYCGDTFDKDIIGAYQAGIFPVYYMDVLEDGPKRDLSDKNVEFSYLTINNWKELIDLLQNLIL